jgi:hypothetical protein
MRVVGGEMRLFLKEWNFYAVRGPNSDGLLPFRVPYDSYVSSIQYCADMKEHAIPFELEEAFHS